MADLSGRNGAAAQPSAVEKLILARMAEVRRDSTRELERAGRQCAALARRVSPPTAAERASMTFSAWVRSREPDFFLSAPTISGEDPLIARRLYERRLEEYSRAWTDTPG